MKVAVFDTYVPKKDGQTMHFDILVAEGTDEAKVFTYGLEYLASVDQEGQPLSTTECRFCHIEQAEPAIETEIGNSGYYILKMENCPGQ